MSSSYYVGTLHVSVENEAALVRVDINAELRDGIYSLTDSTGSMHSWAWNLDDCEPESFLDLAFIAVISYLNHVYHATKGQATCSVLHSGLGLDGLDHVVGSTMFANLVSVPDGVVIQ